MQKTYTIKVLPSEAADEQKIKDILAAAAGVKKSQVNGFQVVRKSLDARSRQAWFHLTLTTFIDEPYQKRPLLPLEFKDVTHAPKRVIVVGAGPAGLFAALRLIE